MKVVLLLLSLLLPLSAYPTDNEVIKVGIIDTGLDVQDGRFSPFLCPNGYKDFTEEGIVDVDGHGTHVAGLVIKYAQDSKFCLLIAKYYSKLHPENNTYYTNKAYRWAIKQGAVLINYSSGSIGSNETESKIIKSANNTVFVTAAGNDHIDFDRSSVRFYPACYNFKNIIAVGCKHNGMICPKSNYGSLVKAYEDGEMVFSTLPGGFYGYMSGTSMSSAIFSGKYIKMLYDKQKTNNIRK